MEKKKERSFLAQIQKTPCYDLPLISVTITGIGDASRQKWINQDMFDKMLNVAKQTIRKTFGFQEKNVILVCGASNESDHVAIRLFLEGGFHGLVLFTPTEVVRNGQGDIYFQDSGEKKNYGRSLNQYHLQFSTRLQIQSLKEMKMALEKGAFLCWKGKKISTSHGLMAQCDFLLMFSWAQDSRSVTHLTWQRCMGSKVHCSLSSLL